MIIHGKIKTKDKKTWLCINFLFQHAGTVAYTGSSITAAPGFLISVISYT